MKASPVAASLYQAYCRLNLYARPNLILPSGGGSVRIRLGLAQKSSSTLGLIEATSRLPFNYTFETAIIILFDDDIQYDLSRLPPPMKICKLLHTVCSIHDSKRQAACFSASSRSASLDAYIGADATDYGGYSEVYGQGFFWQASTNSPFFFSHRISTARRWSPFATCLLSCRIFSYLVPVNNAVLTFFT